MASGARRVPLPYRADLGGVHYVLTLTEELTRYPVGGTAACVCGRGVEQNLAPTLEEVSHLASEMDADFSAAAANGNFPPPLAAAVAEYFVTDHHESLEDVTLADSSSSAAAAAAATAAAATAAATVAATVDAAANATAASDTVAAAADIPPLEAQNNYTTELSLQFLQGKIDMVGRCRLNSG